LKKTLKEELNRLLPNSGIETIHGEFYMRFELGGEGNKETRKRIKQAKERGTEIYKQLIGEDEIIITIQEWENDFFDPNSRNKKYLYNVLKGSELKKIQGPFEQVYYKENENGVKEEKIFEEPLECDLIIGKTKISLEQVSLIIKGIASLEMGEEPCIPQEVYFFSINKRVGFRIYDDRGCDIWADSIENLRPLYKNLNSWILNDNRPEIDKMFKMNTA
jgi:hypothetical protein